MPFPMNDLVSGKPFRMVRMALLLCLVYFVSALAFTVGHGWMILWPLNGITICLLLTHPRAEWPALLLGVSAGLGLSNFFHDGLSPPVIVAVRLLSITEVVLCGLILPRFTQLEHWLRSPRLPFRFCAALLIGPGISGLLYAILVRKASQISFLGALDAWATADALGIAATLPLALSLHSPEMRALFAPRTLLKTLGVFAVAWAITALIFRVEHPPLLFLLYPTLLAVDLILGFAGASIVTLGACILSVYLTVHHPGPLTSWAGGTGSQSNLVLQAYLGFHLIALLPASIVLLERRRVSAELTEANAQLTMLASLDGLTGIANRRTFNERLAQEWSAAIRHGTEIALIMIDIDRFKLYNDQHGHVDGDACLRIVAGLLLNVAERPQDLCARYGGEEFAIILPETSLAGALHQAERLRSTVFDRAIEHCGSPSKRVTLSLGCATLKPRPGDTSTLLLQLADQALYQAKETTRNTVRSVLPVSTRDQPFPATQIAVPQPG